MSLTTQTNFVFIYMSIRLETMDDIVINTLAIVMQQLLEMVFFGLKAVMC